MSASILSASSSTSPPPSSSSEPPDKSEAPTQPPPQSPSAAPAGSLRARVWRWHAVAGLFALPIVALLGTTGGLYLFKPHLEPWLYHDLRTVPAPAVSPAGFSAIPLPLEAQIAAAGAAYPDDEPTGITPATGLTDAAEVSLQTPDRRTRLAYVDPRTGGVLGDLMRDEMLMARVRDLHGNLMAGSIGSAVVELTAGWTLVLLASGLFLWWPRTGSRLWGVWLPRLRSGRRTFWRDLHAVPAFWSAAILLVLLVTGLPWTGVFGGMLQRGLNVAGQSSPPAAGFFVNFESEPPAGRPSLTLTEAASVAEARAVSAGTPITLPRGPRGTFGFVDRGSVHGGSGTGGGLSSRRFLYLDRYTGEPLADAGWADVPVGARALSAGILLHQGELFGWPNLVLMLLGALAAVWLSLTAAAMWWRRRPRGSLGLPPRAGGGRLPRALAVGTIAAGVLFPLLGLSLVVLWAFDRLLPRSAPQSRSVPEST